MLLVALVIAPDRLLVLPRSYPQAQCFVDHGGASEARSSPFEVHPGDDLILETDRDHFGHTISISPCMRHVTARAAAIRDHLSYGGSSLGTFFFVMGLVANVSLASMATRRRGAGEIADTLAGDAGLGPSLVC